MISKYEKKVLEELFKNSYIYPSISRGDVLIKELSKSTGFTMSLVRKAIVSLRKLKILDIDPNYDIHDINNKMPFVIFLNNPICNFLQEKN